MVIKINGKEVVHPYIPNSVPEVQEKMLKKIGVNSIEELFDYIIPREVQFEGRLNLPNPLFSEYELKRHVQGTLSKNKTCEEYICFLGGSTWLHYVPAICDEIAGRAEFLTAYSGHPYENFGWKQAIFEYQSLMAELLDMDVVTLPTYSWGHALGTSLRMASRITGRKEVLVVDTISPERRKIIENYMEPHIKIKWIKSDPETGLIDINDLESKISPDVAAVYFENPSYLGFIEIQGNRISQIAHDKGTLVVVGVDPSSLGVLEPPSHYGADIVCGDLQPLGMHMNFGGGLAGFVATRDDPKFVKEIPYRIFGLVKTVVEGEYGFDDIAFERTSFMVREAPTESREFFGTTTNLWAIIAGVYLALMGPKGMWELGKGILQRLKYAMKRLSEIEGVKSPRFKAPHFKEFVVDFNDTNISVKDINTRLLEYGIFGGINLSKDFPELGNSALYCVTEVHTKEDIDKLHDALEEIIWRR
ncbi:aminomethyl-transferring glycine dehydrogenase subunit GcvPA [Thermococcus sibiricus]|uniref:Glycine cleavage system P-protein n=1 Tax=Thermococcus sibiricus TaxID=172049 RepID=A0A101EMR8_9EURY|nr:aminomethyl-transferring glycine dehydrogenase subunit GcvPA [Thermococcus sibiricus]KUK18032.1 MAG: Glycine cleavage system P-protein [Thermococcus sibiricus]